MLSTAQNHIERGGRPVKKIRIVDKMPLRITCQPMATYFSSALFNKKFHAACMEAERNNRIKAEIGMDTLKKITDACVQVRRSFDENLSHAASITEFWSR